MKPAPFSYHRPATLEEAVTLLHDDEEARPLAGGQSLVPLLNLRLARPSALVDLADVLDATVTVEASALVVGAGITHAELGGHPDVRAHLPLLAACVPYIGHEPIRRRGTLGGSIAHAEPTAELVTAAVATGAAVVIAGPDGRRTQPIDDFVIGPFMTTLEDGELVVGIRFALHHEARTGFAELARRRGDFAIVAAACVVTDDAAGEGAVTVAVAGAGPRPRRVAAVPAGRTGERTAREVAADVAGLVELDVIDEERAYKRTVLPAVVEDALAVTGWFAS